MSGADEEDAQTAVVLWPLPSLTGTEAWALVDGLYALAFAVEGHYGSVIRAFLQDRNASMAAAPSARLFGPDAGAGAPSPGRTDDEPF